MSRTDDAAREARARRTARRKGFMLTRSRRRSDHGWPAGNYGLTVQATGRLTLYGASRDAIEAWLS